MATLRELPPELDTAVRNELHTGEELRYAGVPSPWRTALTKLPMALFGLFLGGFALFWTIGAASSAWFAGNPGAQAVGGMRMVFPLFGLPFLGVGLAAALSPLWAGLRARRTACCVTDQRAVRLQCGGRMTVESWSPRDMTDITKSIHADGTGTLLFARRVRAGSWDRSWESLNSDRVGFHGVPDPQVCEEALLALKASGSILRA